MNYYIQGNKQKADQIKAEFENKGYNTNVNGWNFNADCGVYFTNEADKSVDYTSNETFVNLIKTHPGYTELELPVKPKFKVGDLLQSGSHFFKILSINLEEERYYCDNRIISFKNQDLWHLVPKPHYDIANFSAGMPVLVRDSDESRWLYTIFGMHDKNNKIYPFVVVDRRGYVQCIPFEGNEHLLGTTDPCDEMYINWELIEL